ncbi:DUF262 domain-containing protein [Aliarcobacter butzleri]|uniref:DUF262 domain-containing protein n=1 Tax=Aliarcobacter butzleri TaxID=28197 RepID=UPI0012F9FF00|nr:DUF262 domain-containing protein [Aliarcobacter butzleri]
MENNSIQYTFWELIKNYKIVIPIIQRDYAQGRDGIKISEIRRFFLNTLYEMIDNKDKSVDLDFVYGSIKLFKNFKSDNEDKVFTPLDGQQRLTTLFLLHWYLARDENGLLSNEHKEILKNFTYETRTSSKEFCRDLINNKIILEDNSSAKEVIINSSWFFLAWQKDPTIKSMLNMIEDIHRKFQNNRNKLFDSLVSKTEKPITFQFLELNNFGLTDSLYIKMNARGKPLTEFENFKAKFEQFLESKRLLNSEELRKEFSIKIDGIWTDFFWKYRNNNHIDNAIMKYFLFISEMLYYKDNKDTPEFYFEQFEQIENIYLDINSENIRFLFDAYDFLHNSGDINRTFEELFSKNIYEQDKINLFSENINLFENCINSDNFGIYEKVLFFTVIKYLVDKKINTVDEKLKNIVRILRNLLLRVRQQNQTKFNSNLRYENMSKFIESSLKLIDTEDCLLIDALSGYSKESLDFEKDKQKLINENESFEKIIYELENHKLLQGSIHNLKLFDNPINAGKYLTAFKEIWSIDDNSLVIRALLTVGDYSIVSGWSHLGNRWFFGEDEGWHTILTNANKEVQERLSVFLKDFLDLYIKLELNDPIEKLSKLIENWLEVYKDSNWRYYFVKYPGIVESSNSLFTFKNDESNFEIRSLTGNSLRAWHINPYVKIVSESCKIDYSDSWSKTSDSSPLILETCELWCMEDGWHIYTYEDYEFENELKNTFNLIEKKDSNNIDYFLLQDTENKDRVEIAIEFIGNL